MTLMTVNIICYCQVNLRSLYIHLITNISNIQFMTNIK